MRTCGDDDRLASTCMRSSLESLSRSRSPPGLAAVELCGESVAIGGKAMPGFGRDPPPLPPLPDDPLELEWPTPTGRGCGGRTTDGTCGGGLPVAYESRGGGWRLSGEWDGGWVRNGMGEGRVDCTGVCRPRETDERRRIVSVRVRLLSLSSDPGLRGRLSWAAWDDGDAWLRVDDTEPRCDEGGARGEGSLPRLPDEMVGDCTGREDSPAAMLAELGGGCPRYCCCERFIRASIPSS